MKRLSRALGGGGSSSAVAGGKEPRTPSPAGGVGGGTSTATFGGIGGSSRTPQPAGPSGLRDPDHGGHSRASRGGSGHNTPAPPVTITPELFENDAFRTDACTKLPPAHRARESLIN